MTLSAKQYCKSMHTKVHCTCMLYTMYMYWRTPIMQAYANTRKHTHAKSHTSYEAMPQDNVQCTSYKCTSYICMSPLSQGISHTLVHCTTYDVQLRAHPYTYSPIPRIHIPKYRSLNCTLVQKHSHGVQGRVLIVLLSPHCIIEQPLK